MTEGDPTYAFFLPNLGIGGAERMAVHLADHLAEDLRVELVLAENRGDFVDLVPESVSLVSLDAAQPPGYGIMGALPGLVRYLRRERPRTLVSFMSHVNVVALLAGEFARVDTRLIVSQRNHYSTKLARRPAPIRHGMRALIQGLYPWADEIIAISNGVRDDLVDNFGVSPDAVSVVYNPVVTPDLRYRAADPIDHQWFGDGSPGVILGVGSLIDQKDFETLMRAFAGLRDSRDVRLVILGDGERRPDLESLAESLGIADDVDLPGYVENPYPYMANAAVFALSSQWEGFGNVLVEAMACGCPVVATDCPSGPREILDDGAFGPLVPVADPTALERALARMLDDRPDPDRLRERARDFTVERIAAEYRSLMVT